MVLNGLFRQQSRGFGLALGDVGIAFMHTTHPPSYVSSA